MSTVRTIARNTLSLAVAEVITKLLAFILVIFVARYLGDVDYGKYAFALAFTSFFAIIADPGFSTLTIRELARDKELAGKYLGNISLVKFILSFVAFLLVVIFINLMHYPSDTTLAVYIAGAYVVLTSFNQFFISIFRAFEKMEYETLVRIIEKVILFSLVITFIYLGYGLIEIVSAFLISSIFSFVFCGLVVLRKFTKPKFEIDFSFLKHATKEALPFALTAVFTVIYFRIDTVLLSMMKGDAVVGWYNAAYNIIFGLMIIPLLYTTAIFPAMSRFSKSSIDAFNKIGTLSFKYLLILGLPISIGVTLLADKIILLVYGPEYIVAIIALQILVWSFFIMCLCGIPTTSLNATNKQHIVTAGMGITAILNIILNLILIPKYSLVGAAIATIIVCFFEFFFEFYFMNKYAVKIRLVNGDFAKVIFASFVMCSFIIYFPANIFLTIILATFIYGLFIIVSKAFSKEDLSMLKKIISGGE
jgi:O-antigen/teichoic acid export membrane protein